MKYPKPTDRYSCEVLCENFMEVDERLTDLEENGVGGGGVGGTRYAVTEGTGSDILATIDGVELEQGTMITLMFKERNLSNATLNVNGLGAKPIYYKGSAILGSMCPADAIVSLVYDTTVVPSGAWHCVYSYDSNNTYTNASLGQGYGVCSTAATVAAKTVTMGGFSYQTGGMVAIRFVAAVEKGATLNINATGDKTIYGPGGSTLQTNVIKAGDTAIFALYNSAYYLVSVDRHTSYSVATSTSLGLTRHYTGTGTNTNGTMTQKAITDELNLKENAGAAEGAVSQHNVSESAHNDIRLLIEGLTSRLNALANSDDTTLDQMAEIVQYIKTNRNIIETVTTTKVNVSDIIDNVVTSVSNKPLSAKQGVVLKGLIDAIVVPTKTSQLTNDSGFLTSVPSEYVTETELNAKGYLTSHQDISGKADKSSAETWTFTLADGSTVTKKVVLA